MNVFYAIFIEKVKTGEGSKPLFFHEKTKCF